MKERRLEHGLNLNTPKRIIVHSMAQYIDTGVEKVHAVDWLDRLGYSAHVFVEPDGTPIRSREDDEGAFHALGNNTDTLGIEILVHGAWDYGRFLQRISEPWTTRLQFLTSVEIVREWQHKWEIDSADVVRHSDVDPERKHDPGRGFPWAGFQLAISTGSEYQ